MKPFLQILSVLAIIAAIICVSTAADVPTTAEIQKRIAELSRISMKSASGNFVVVGSNRVENFALGRWCDSAVKRISIITGNEPFLKGRRISIHAESSNSGKSAFVRYPPTGSLFAAKVYLSDYSSAYEERGRQAICCAILALYKRNPARDMLEMPRWLWLGIEQNLLFDVRSRNLEQTLSLWRKGHMKPLRYYLFPKSMEKTPPPDAKTGNLQNAVCAAFVRFLESRQNKKELFSALLIQNRGKNYQSLEKLVCGSNPDLELDDLWERWLLQQGNVIRSSATLSSRTIDQLRAELTLHPGTFNIPLNAKIRRGATFEDLINYRKAEWLPGFISIKRGRIAMLAAGRGKEMANTAALFDRYLAGLTGRESDIQLLARLNTAYLSLKKLADKIEKGDGMLYEINPEVNIEIDE